MGGSPDNIKKQGKSFAYGRVGGKFGRKVIKPPAVSTPKKEAMTPTAQPSQRTQQVKATLSGEDADTKSTLGG